MLLRQNCFETDGRGYLWRKSSRASASPSPSLASTPTPIYERGLRERAREGRERERERRLHFSCHKIGSPNAQCSRNEPFARDDVTPTPLRVAHIQQNGGPLALPHLSTKPWLCPEFAYPGSNQPTIARKPISASHPDLHITKCLPLRPHPNSEIGTNLSCPSFLVATCVAGAVAPSFATSPKWSGGAEGRRGDRFFADAAAAAVLTRTNLDIVRRRK